MVQAHQDSREDCRTNPIPPEETEKIWYGSSDPQRFLQLQHCLVWQLLSLQPQGTTEGSANSPVHHWGQAKLPAIQDLYTRQCQRKALTIVKDSSHPVIDCSLCYHTASGTGAPRLGPRGFLNASTPSHKTPEHLVKWLPRLLILPPPLSTPRPLSVVIYA